jgi:Tol biopolymer transport system component
VCPNLVPGDTNNSYDVFVRDRAAGTLERVSVDSAGVQGNDWSFAPSISADGRYVAFDSIASNLVADDGNFDFDISSATARCTPRSGSASPPAAPRAAWDSAASTRRSAPTAR